METPSNAPALTIALARRARRALRSCHPRAYAPLIALACALAHARTAQAETVPLAIADRGTNRINIDGILTDWERFTELTPVESRDNVTRGDTAWTGPDDASFSFALAQDAQGLYLAARVRDERLVRSAAHRPEEDALVLTLAVSTGANGAGAAHVEELLFYPGDPGNFAGIVRTRSGRVVSTAQLVELPARGGGAIAIEAMIPWASLGPIRAQIATLRGRLAYQDADDDARAATDTLLSTGPGDHAHADALAPARGSRAAALDELVTAFQQERSLVGTPPLFDRTVNVAGDAAPERVLVYPRFLMAAGPGINNGTSYGYVEIPVATRGDLLEAQTRDVTGDGAHEVLLTVREQEREGLVREVLLVYGATNGAVRLGRIFAHELSRTQGPNAVRTRLTVEPSGALHFTLGESNGYTAASYPRAVEEGVEPPLTPWGAYRAETFRWADGLQRFERARTEPNPNAVPEPGASSPGATAQPAGPMANEAAPPDVAGTLAMFRRQRNIAENVRPSFSQQSDVAEDSGAETVQLFGRTLVIVGARFMGGRSFYTMDLPEGSEVLSVQLRDVTRDNKSDAIVRIRRSTPLTLRGQTRTIVRENLLVYSFDGATRGRVFAAEVSRRDGAEAIENVVRPVSSGANGELTIESGRAIGWTQQTYPFRDTPTPGFAPLLLPWERERVTYRWNGSALAP